MTQSSCHPFPFIQSFNNRISFDVLSHPELAYVSGRLTDPSVTTIFSTWFGCGESGAFTLAASGVYTLLVDNAGDAESGIYSFRLVQVVARSDPRLVHSVESKYKM